MRADRLVAVLLLLQQRGHVTAAQVAAELEVSERTARRDLDALAIAGLPVYSTQGRGGGWRLAGDGRTDLSGLTSAEARALFLVAGPADGASTEVRAALRKLVRALPEPLRDQAEAAAGALVVDPEGWDRTGQRRPPPPFLDALQGAVIDGEQVRLRYVARDRTPSTRVVHPLGLASKGRIWYLVAGTDGGLRTFRVERVEDVERTGDPVVRPPDFRLADAWAAIADEVDRKRTPLTVRAVAETSELWILRARFGTRLAVGPSVGDGRVEVELRGHSAFSMAAEIAGFASSLAVLEPADVRHALAGIGAALVERYGGPVGQERPALPR